jgi:hypothetical protein
MAATKHSMNDLGHQGEVDVTQIEKMLRLTPTERLRRHESWRPFARRAWPVQSFVERVLGGERSAIRSQR